MGMVTKGDLLRVACLALEDPGVWQQPVSRFMAHGVLALRPTDSLASAVEYLTEPSSGACPSSTTSSGSSGWSPATI